MSGGITAGQEMMSKVKTNLGLLRRKAPFEAQALYLDAARKAGLNLPIATEEEMQAFRIEIQHRARQQRIRLWISLGISLILMILCITLAVYFLN